MIDPVTETTKEVEMYFSSAFERFNFALEAPVHRQPV